MPALSRTGDGAGHTPGPWSTDGDVPYCHDSVIDSTGLLVADCAIFGPGPYERCTQANARLIAAAPDLLAALRLLVVDVADYEAWQRPCHALEVAQAAIARAEGR